MPQVAGARRGQFNHRFAQPNRTAAYSSSHPLSAAANAATGSFCHWLALLPIHRATSATAGFNTAVSSTALRATGSISGMVDLFACGYQSRRD